MSYSSVDQQAQLLAQEASSLLPGHPRVRSKLSYAQIPPIKPDRLRSRCRGPAAGRSAWGSARARLLLFFATWDSRGDGPRRAARGARRLRADGAGAGLPALTAVDEGSVEPSPGALPALLATPARVRSPIRSRSTAAAASPTATACRTSRGSCSSRLPAGSSGTTTSRPLAGSSRAQLVSRMPRRADPRTANGTPAAARQELAGSPPPLAALHRQAGQLLGRPESRSRPGSARCAATRSSSTPGRRGAPRAARSSGCSRRASARYGRQVAFLGVDTSDSPGDARSFLGTASGQLPELPEHHHRHSVARRDRGAADDDLHRPRRQGRLRPHGPVRRRRGRSTRTSPGTRTDT